MAGRVEAAVHSGGDCLLHLTLEPAGPPSVNVAELKQRTMACMTEFLQRQNMSTEDVDLMEEVISDDEGAGAKGAKGQGKSKGKKRKQQGQAQT